MKYFLSLLLSILSLVLCAQNFDFLTSKHGLPSNLIYQVAQDTSGFLWIATPRGVSRFDGETFKTFTTKEGFTTNDIFSLAISEDNKIWTGTKSNLQGYIQRDSVHLFPVKNNLVVTVAYTCIIKDGFAFAHTTSQQGSKYCLTDGVWTPEYISNSIPRTKGSLLPDSTRFERLDLWPVAHTNLLVDIVNDSTLYYYSKKGVLLDSKPLSEKLPRYRALDRRYAYFSDSVFSYFFKDRLFKINLLSGYCEITYYKDIRSRFDSLSLPSSSYFNNQTFVNFKNLSLIFNRQAELIGYFDFPKDVGQNFISLDHWGNAWAIGSSIGLGYMDRSMIKSQYLVEKQNIRTLFHQNNILYIATYKGAIYKLNTQTGQLETHVKYPEIIYQIKEGLHPNEVAAISAARFGTINTPKNPQSFGHSLSTYSGFKDFCYHQNSLFIASHLGVIKYDSLRESVLGVALRAGVTSLEIFDSTLYIGSSIGLQQWQPDTAVYTSIPGIPKNVKVKKLKKYFSKYLLIATEGSGIYAIDGKQYFEVPATKDLIVENIFVENDSTLWLATEDGIKLLRFNPKNIPESYIVSSFYECDGLLSDRVNDIVVKDSLIYAGTDLGLSILNKKHIFHKKAPPLYIDEIVSGNQKLKKDDIHLTYGSSPILVTYGAICFAGREHLNFQYRLSNGEWITTSSRELNFNDLQPGSYELQIKVTDHHKNFSLKTLTITISPLWWQTSWFKVLLILLTIILLFISYRFTKKRISRREKDKADFERKLSGLELMALRSQMNPHFVFNSLSAIQYFITENQLALSEKYLVKFSKLIRLFFEYSRVRSLSLKEEIELLENYLTIEKMRFGDKLDFSILIDDNLDIEETHIPSMLLQPLVENAVNHGLFHKKGNGKIEIEFIYNHNYGFDVFIKDDGVGMNKAIEIRKSSKQNYRSSSTQVIKENILLLNQQGEWLINYKTNNRYPQQEDSGTVVHLNFKLKPKPHEN